MMFLVSQYRYASRRLETPSAAFIQRPDYTAIEVLQTADHRIRLQSDELSSTARSLWISLARSWMAVFCNHEVGLIIVSESWPHAPGLSIVDNLSGPLFIIDNATNAALMIRHIQYLGQTRTTPGARVEHKFGSFYNFSRQFNLSISNTILLADASTE
jgi:hypothetical protein